MRRLTSPKALREETAGKHRRNAALAGPVTRG
jgi:hypothetical protein